MIWLGLFIGVVVGLSIAVYGVLRILGQILLGDIFE